MKIFSLFFLFTFLSVSQQVVADGNEYSYAHSIAMIDNNERLDANHKSVVLVELLLTEIHLQTGEPDKTIADLTGFTRQKINEDFGKNISYVDIMESALEILKFDPSLEYKAALGYVYSLSK